MILSEESLGCQLILKKIINKPMKTPCSQSPLNFWQEMSGGLMPVARRLLAIIPASKPREKRFSVAGRLKADLWSVARHF